MPPPIVTGKESCRLDLGRPGVDVRDHAAVVVERVDEYPIDARVRDLRRCCDRFALDHPEEGNVSSVLVEDRASFIRGCSTAPSRVPGEGIDREESRIRNGCEPFSNCQG